MDIQPLSIEGAWVIDVPTFGGDRGSFRQAFRRVKLDLAICRTAQIARAGSSRSAKGVVRGVHFADGPLGQSRHLQVVSGRNLGVIMGFRSGSRRFARHEAGEPDMRTGRAVFLAEGLGRARQGLGDDTAVMCLVSDVYPPQREHGNSPRNPAPWLSWPVPITTGLLSERDAAAPGLEESLKRGTLPSWDACLEHYVSAALPGS